MIQFDLDAQATVSYYSALKSATQTGTYIGVFCTASLGVFDFVLKQRSDPLPGSNRFILNNVGRVRLLAFIMLATVTLTCTIVKDYADRRLDAISKKEAQAKAASDQSERDQMSATVKDTKKIAETVSQQNADMKKQLDSLRLDVGEGNGYPQAGSSGSACLKNAAQDELQQLNAFLKDRFEKSYANNPNFANDPDYSKKQVAYQKETSQLYIQRFWPSIQQVLIKAKNMNLMPEKYIGLADPNYYPSSQWSEAMLRPGYDEIADIVKSAPVCN